MTIMDRRTNGPARPTPSIPPMRALRSQSTLWCDLKNGDTLAVLAERPVQRGAGDTEFSGDLLGIAPS